jgi:hypothetical protein
MISLMTFWQAEASGLFFSALSCGSSVVLIKLKKEPSAPFCSSARFHPATS